MIKKLEGHTLGLYKAIYSPDNKIICSCSDDKTIKVWNALTGECNKTLKYNSAEVYCIAFSKNGKYLVSGY